MVTATNIAKAMLDIVDEYLKERGLLPMPEHEVGGPEADRLEFQQRPIALERLHVVGFATDIPTRRRDTVETSSPTPPTGRLVARHHRQPDHPLDPRPIRAPPHTPQPPNRALSIVPACGANIDATPSPPRGQPVRDRLGAGLGLGRRCARFLARRTVVASALVSCRRRGSGRWRRWRGG